MRRPPGAPTSGYVGRHRRDTAGRHRRVAERGRLWAALALLFATVVPVLGTPAAGAQDGPLPAPVAATLTPDYRDAVYGGFVLAGNSSLRCPLDGEVTGGPTAADCVAATANAQDGGGLLTDLSSNNGYYMHLADDDGRDDTFTSSRAELTVPAGATVRHARLQWGGHTGTFIGFSGVNCTRPLQLQGDAPPEPSELTPAEQAVGLALDGGEPQLVPRVDGRFRTTEGAAEPSQVYLDWADVTEQVAAAVGTSTGDAVEVSVSNVWSPTGPGCAAGWSLLVVYGHDAPTDDAPALRVVDVYADGLPSGGALTSGLLEPLVPGFPSVVEPLLPGIIPVTGAGVVLPGVAPSPAEADVELGVTAYDGDWRHGGDQLTVNGEPVTEPCLADTADDFFRSCANSAIDPVDATLRPRNNLSVDAKTVRPVLAADAGPDIALGVESVADFVVLQSVVLAQSVDPHVTVAVAPVEDTVREGDLATFDVDVTNDGSLPLTDVRVAFASAPAAPGAACTPEVLPPLAPGDTRRVTCVQPVGAPGVVTGVATVTGTYLTTAAGEPRTVTATGDAAVTVEPADYAIERVPSALTVRAGSPVTFTVTLVNNTGNALTDVVYADEATTDCSPAPPGVLDAASRVTFACVVAAVADSFSSAGSFTGVDLDGSGVEVTSQSVLVDVVEPTVAVDQALDKAVIYRGDTVELTFDVTNTADEETEALTGVAVTVEALPDCAPEPIAELRAGDVATVSCVAAPQQTGDLVATVTGTDVTGGAVTAASEPDPIEVLDPLIEVTQAVDDGILRVGDEATFTFTVTHVGTDADGPVTGVELANPTVPPDCRPEPVGDLAVGESVTRSCVASPERTFTSVTVASATDRLGRPMRVATDELPIAVHNPAVTIETEATPDEAARGADVDFIVTVRNVGDVPMTLDVTNDRAEDCDFALTDDDTLEPGAAHGRRCTVVASGDELTNVAEFTADVAEAVGDDGEPLTGADDATVRISGEAVDPDPGAGDPGGGDPTDPGGDPGGGATGPGDPDGPGDGGVADGPGGPLGSESGSGPGTPGSAQGRPDLPNTGVSLAVPAGLGVSLLVGGALMLGVASRRRDDEPATVTRPSGGTAP